MMNYTQIYICIFILFGSPANSEPQHITCPSEPPIVRRFQLEERWRVDVESQEIPVIGYTYESQVFFHDGLFYFLDGQLGYIHIFGEHGEYLGKILGEGDGPGEVRNPGSMFLCSDGRIAVQHGYPSKLEFVDLKGNPMGRWRLQANAFANRLQETPQGWFGIYNESKQSDDPSVFQSEMHVALHDNEGVRTHEFFSATKKSHHRDGGSTDEEDEFVPWYSAIAVGDGEVLYSAERNQYRLEWRNESGELTRVATRNFQSHRRTPDELNTIKYRSYSIVNGDFVFANRKLSNYDPVIQSIEELADGSLRVRTSLYQKELPSQMVCRYDVHEATGELRERIEIYDATGEYDVDYDVIALLEKDCVVVLRNVRPASRVAHDSRLHPELQKQLPPIPDDREDIVFTPVIYDLVPFAGDSETGF